MTQGRSYLAGLVTGVAVTGVLGIVGLRATAAPRTATTDAAPTEAAPIAAAPQAAMPKPAVKVLLENDQVRVREVVFAPGAGDTHTHQWAHVGVILTKGQLAFADAGKPEEVVAFEAGSAAFATGGSTAAGGTGGATTFSSF